MLSRQWVKVEPPLSYVDTSRPLETAVRHVLAQRQRQEYGNLQYVSNGYKVGWQSNRTNPNRSTTVLATGTATLPATSVGWHYWETKS